jgi:hypothetical protein
MGWRSQDGLESVRAHVGVDEMDILSLLRSPCSVDGRGRRYVDLRMVVAVHMR